MSRIAIVTGGTAGLGRAMTLALLQAGHRVAAVGRSAEPAAELTAAAQAAGTAERLMTLRGDIRDPADCAAIVERTIARFGGLDALVNNAGINLPTEVRRSDPKFWKVDTAVWRDIIDTNVNGSFLMAHAAAPTMLERGWGRIVNHLTSLRSLIRPGGTPYGPSKAALEAMVAAWSAETAGSGVTVNAIMPGGAANTRMVSPLIQPDRSKLVDPAMMGPPICWLLSDAADGFSGYCITAEHWDPRAGERENLDRAATVCGWKDLLTAESAVPRTAW